MKKKTLINILLAVLIASLVLLGFYIDNPEYAQIFEIAAIVIGVWLIMRIFNIKPLATKE